MTLMKSLLLGSAATFVVVAGAQAADLPTKKGAPAAEYVKVCKIGDIAGFIIPGTDTCLKLSGFVTARYAAGSTHDQYSIANFADPLAGLVVSKTARSQDAYGAWSRARLYVDAASNTAYGPLIGHAAFQGQFGTGYVWGAGGTDSASVDKAWITWAGLTAGKVESFFSAPFLDASINSDMDLIGSDSTVNLLAYTATFGGGFAATISMESPVGRAGTTTYANNGYFGTTLAPTMDGWRSPDWVAALDVTQGWGAAHLAGVAHQIRAEITGLTTEDTWGWGVIGGVKFNLPMLGAGADVKIVANYTEGDLGQSGMFNPWNLNLSGVAFNGATGDIYYDFTKGWIKPKAWTVTGGFDLPFGGNFKVSPEISYGHVELSVPTSSFMSKTWYEWVGGATFEWSPVHNLVFDLDLLYESGHQDKPQAWTTAMDNRGVAWKSNFDGFIGELRVERDF